VDFLSPSLSRKARVKLVHSLTVEQPHAVRSFVEALPMEVVSVVVHCEGGYSRSCAIALALHRLYGYRAEIKHLSQAKLSIVNMMVGNEHAHHRKRPQTPR
jgi:protein-tyrosine phosphatase